MDGGSPSYRTGRVAGRSTRYRVERPATLPVRYEGDPPSIWGPCRPVVQLALIGQPRQRALSELIHPQVDRPGCVSRDAHDEMRAIRRKGERSEMTPQRGVDRLLVPVARDP